MGKNLIALAGKSKLSNGKPVGGKAGRLSRPTIDKLQKYYGNAIRRRVDKAKTKREVDNAVKKMQWAVKAVLYHSVKIDDEKKRHQYCPNGESSWCSYRRDKADGTNAPFVNTSHHLDQVFLEFLTQLFDRLSEKKLLERCQLGLSRNAIHWRGTDVPNIEIEESNLLKQQPHLQSCSSTLVQKVDIGLWKS